MPEQNTRPTARALRWRTWLGPLVVFALSCVVFEASAEIVTLPPAWRTFEFCQYAEIGKNLATEGAYNTRLVEPMALALIDRDEVGAKTPGRWPVVNRYPLPAVVIAGLMKVFGATDYVAAWSNGLAAGLLAATVYAAARAWFGRRWAALAAALWLLNPSSYGEFILLGTPDPWFAALLMVEVLAWARLAAPGESGGPRPARWGMAVGVGALGGLAYLARFNASVFLAVQVGVLAVGCRRWREAAVVAASALAVASPSMAENYRHFGRPAESLYSAWNLLDRIDAYGVEPWLYYRVPDVRREVADHWPAFVRKVEANLRLLAGPAGIWALWRLEVLIPLGVAGLRFGGGRGSHFRRAAGMALGLFGLQLVLFSGLRLEVGDPNSAHNGRYFFWFAPFAVLLGVATLRRLATARRRWAAWALVIGAVGLQLGLYARGWEGIARFHLNETTNIGADPIRQMLGEVVRPGEVIASNQPQVTAWFVGLRSVSLPADPDELDRLNRASPTPADYLFVDTNFNAIELDRRWSLLADAAARRPSPWEARLLRDYRYVIPPRLTRPMKYVILRRNAVPAGRIEREMAGRR